MVLGLLLAGPRHGYDLHRIVVAHGPLYADFKKPTLYHLLGRLADQGAVRFRLEGGARGARGERLVYSITAAGRRLFGELLRTGLRSYDGTQTGLEVAVVFLAHIPAGEAAALLRERRDRILERRAVIAAELGPLAGPSPADRIEAGFLAADHALSFMDTEIGWIDRVVAHLEAAGPRRACSASARKDVRSAIPRTPIPQTPLEKES